MTCIVLKLEIAVKPQSTNRVTSFSVTNRRRIAAASDRCWRVASGYNRVFIDKHLPAACELPRLRSNVVASLSLFHVHRRAAEVFKCCL